MPNPYASLTDSTEVVSSYLLTQLEANKALFTTPQGNPVVDVLYGDESGLLAHTPTLCIVSGPETATPNGAGGRPVLMAFQTFVMVYAMAIADHQLNVHASLTIANAIKRFMNQDPTLGGNAIDFMCVAVDPGIAVRGGALIDTSRMTFRTLSKVALNA